MSLKEEGNANRTYPWVAGRTDDDLVCGEGVADSVVRPIVSVPFYCQGKGAERLPYCSVESGLRGFMREHLSNT